MHLLYFKQRRKSRRLKRLLFMFFAMIYIAPLSASNTCGNNDQAKQLSELIQKHAQQQRVKISCHPKLTEIALFKVSLLSQEDVIMHNIGYLTPNQLLRDQGYNLSKIYPILGNQVEAIAAGNKTVQATFQQLLDSPRHRNLLLGISEFYRHQNQIGVAYLQQKVSPFDHYWVVYLADSHRNENTKTDYTVSFDFPSLQQNSDETPKELSIRERHEQSRHKQPLNGNQ